MPISLAMVMLSSDVPMRGADIHKALGEHWPSLPAMTDPQEEDGSIAFRVGAADIILGKMPAPIPWTELEGPCATSLLWRNAAEEVKQHQIHWVVTVSGELNPMEMSTLLTQATAATLAACPTAIGVYWGNATLVIPKGIFCDFARKVLPLGPPLHIWLDFRVGRDTEKTSAGFTAGLKALGHMEFEAQNAPEPPGELRERLLSLAGYVLEKGPVIRNGDSVGEDAEERIRVVYAPSAFGHEGQVMRLQYEQASPARPWWKLWKA
jgi:hypothetical protein